MKTSSILIFSIIAIVAVVGLLKLAEHNEQKLSAFSDCVFQTAQEEGYKGSPYTQEAWLLFGSNCNK